jgi:excisionase family DNA binding protein
VAGEEDGAVKAESEEYLTIKQAAARYGISADCLYDLCQSNRLAHYRIGPKGGLIRVRPADIGRYLRSCRVESVVPTPPRPPADGRTFRNFTL